MKSRILYLIKTRGIATLCGKIIPVCHLKTCSLYKTCIDNRNRFYIKEHDPDRRAKNGNIKSDADRHIGLELATTTKYLFTASRSVKVIGVEYIVEVVEEGNRHKPTIHCLLCEKVSSLAIMYRELAFVCLC